jgi:integrase
MPRKPLEMPICCEYFTWRLFQRDEVYYADGREGRYNRGKHSLGTKDRDEAIAKLRRLDCAKAVEFGLAERERLNPTNQLPIRDGWQLYMDHCGRSPILGGVSPATLKRYRAVREKHEEYCIKHGIAHWNEFDKSQLTGYCEWLSHKKYAARTIFLELTTVKTIPGWLIEQGRLPEECRIRYSLTRPTGTDTYAYQPAEVRAMIQHCRKQQKLHWLGNVLTGLAFTGCRIGELAALRWSDVDLVTNTIHIADERFSQKKQKTGAARTTKGKRSRTIPLHHVLKSMLAEMPRHADGYVFHSQTGRRLRERNALAAFIDNVIEPLKARFSVPPGDIGFEHGRLHSFRHFFCSQAFADGASEGNIKDWLGHADSIMVEHYRHQRPGESQRKMQSIDFLGSDAPEDREKDTA